MASSADSRHCIIVQSGQREFVLPASFDPVDLLPRSLHRYSDDARYIASTIIRKTARGQADDGGYVALKAEYLRNIISKRRGREVVESLLSAEAIRRTPYQVGVRSFAYRLDDRFRGDPHIRRPVECKRLLKKLEAHAARYQQKADRRMKPIHHELARLQNWLEIDAAESKAILTTMPVESNPFDIQGVLVRDIIERNFRISVGNYGRVANSITNMKRELRAALRCAGHPIAGVDISCAQPCLLCLLIRMCRENVPSYMGLGFALPAALPAVLPPCCTSVDRFAAVCLSGDLFGILGLRLRDNGHLWTRDLVKRRFLADVLAKKKAGTSGEEYPSPIENVFRAEFPGVWQFIRDVNADGWEHATLIRMLQQLESWLVIENVCDQFATRHPGEFVISLHDACYVRPEMLGALVDTFEGVFSRLDWRPTLKVESEA